MVSDITVIHETEYKPLLHQQDLFQSFIYGFDNVHRTVTKEQNITNRTIQKTNKMKVILHGTKCLIFSCVILN